MQVLLYSDAAVLNVQDREKGEGLLACVATLAIHNGEHQGQLDPDPTSDPSPLQQKNFSKTATYHPPSVVL